MSLLNDALKRAGEKGNGRAGGGSSLPPLQPVDYAARPNRTLRFLLMGLLVLTIGLSAYFLNRWLKSLEDVTGKDSKNTVNAIHPHPRAGVAATPSSVIRVSTNFAPGAAPALQSPPPVAPSTAPATDVSTIATGAPLSTGAMTSAVPSVGEDTFPVLKLQSIIFRLHSPSVVINGEMLGVGDAIKGARVVKIDRRMVTLEWRGQTNVLELPRL